MDLSQLKSRRYDINKLVEAAQEANGTKQDNPIEMRTCGNQLSIRQAMDSQSSDSSPPTTKYHGFDTGTTDSRVRLASGTSRSH